MNKQCALLLLLCNVFMIYASKEPLAKGLPKTKALARIPFAETWTSNNPDSDSMDCAVRRSVAGGAWYAVYGGHDGLAIVENLFPNLHRWFEQAQGSTIEERMKNAFDKANNDKKSASGSSVAVVFIKDNTAHIAYVGDCRVAMIQNEEIKFITMAHTALNEQEVQRIENLKIENVRFDEASDSRYNLSYIQTFKRVGDVKNDVTRSIGDSEVDQRAITPEPEYVQYRLTDPSGSIIIGSYGFWKNLVQPTESKAEISIDRLNKHVDQKVISKIDNIARIKIFLGKNFDPFWHKVKQYMWVGANSIGFLSILVLLCSVSSHYIMN